MAWSERVERMKVLVEGGISGGKPPVLGIQQAYANAVEGFIATQDPRRVKSTLWYAGKDFGVPPSTKGSDFPLED